MYRTAPKGRRAEQQLPVALDARRRMLEFYRERDREDAERYASGRQRVRGVVYASGAARLESDGDVYESFRVIRAAGIELSAQAEAMVAALPQDWRQVCRIDSQGRLWTASLREKRAAYTR